MTVMADPIGILSFALHAAHKIYELIEQIRDAPDEIRALKTEAARARTLLNRLHKDLEDYKLVDEEDLLRPLLVEAQQLTDATTKFIKKVVKESSHAPDRVDVNKIKWILHAGSGKKLGEQFRQFYLSLNPVCVAVTS